MLAEDLGLMRITNDINILWYRYKNTESLDSSETLLDLNFDIAEIPEKTKALLEKIYNKQLELSSDKDTADNVTLLTKVFLQDSKRNSIQYNCFLDPDYVYVIKKTGRLEYHDASLDSLKLADHKEQIILKKVTIINGHLQCAPIISIIDRSKIPPTRSSQLCTAFYNSRFIASAVPTEERHYPVSNNSSGTPLYESFIQSIGMSREPGSPVAKKQSIAQPR